LGFLDFRWRFEDYKWFIKELLDYLGKGWMGLLASILLEKYYFQLVGFGIMDEGLIHRDKFLFGIKIVFIYH